MTVDIVFRSIVVAHRHGAGVVRVGKFRGQTCGNTGNSSAMATVIGTAIATVSGAAWQQ
jgi:hypothetical protein